MKKTQKIQNYPQKIIKNQKKLENVKKSEKIRKSETISKNLKKIIFFQKSEIFEKYFFVAEKKNRNAILLVFQY